MSADVTLPYCINIPRGARDLASTFVQKGEKNHKFLYLGSCHRAQMEITARTGKHLRSGRSFNTINTGTN
jgi:hypothetical protein